MTMSGKTQRSRVLRSPASVTVAWIVSPKKRIGKTDEENNFSTRIGVPENRRLRQ